jgi:hypothetical protein
LPTTVLLQHEGSMLHEEVMTEDGVDQLHQLETVEMNYLSVSWRQATLTAPSLTSLTLIGCIVEGVRDDKKTATILDTVCDAAPNCFQKLHSLCLHVHNIHTSYRFSATVLGAMARASSHTYITLHCWGVDTVYRYPAQLTRLVCRRTCRSASDPTRDCSCLVPLSRLQEMRCFGHATVKGVVAVMPLRQLRLIEIWSEHLGPEDLVRV